MVGILEMEILKMLPDVKARKDAILSILNNVNAILDAEPAVLTINSDKLMIVGDIHGNIDALKRVLEERERLGCNDILFLGDYVDRGDHSLDVLLVVLSLKLHDREHVFLLRGNHEHANMNFMDGFYKELDGDESFLTTVHKTYGKLSVAAVVNKRTFCVHGGIKDAISIDDITKDEIDSLQYLWNDPSTHLGLRDSSRGFPVKTFGRDIFTDFMTINNFDKIIRGHQFVENGYLWHFQKRLLTLFSCPDYSGSCNICAFAILERSNISVHQFDTNITLLESGLIEIHDQQRSFPDFRIEKKQISEFTRGYIKMIDHIITSRYESVGEEESQKILSFTSEILSDEKMNPHDIIDRIKDMMSYSLMARSTGLDEVFTGALQWAKFSAKADVLMHKNHAEVLDVIKNEKGVTSRYLMDKLGLHFHDIMKVLDILLSDRVIMVEVVGQSVVYTLR